MKGEKADIWEAGHRIPFIARWPGHIPANTVCDETGSLTDLMGTLAAMLHRPLPQDAGEDSFNLLPALLHEPHAPIRKTIVEESNGGMFSIREGDWKPSWAWAAAASQNLARWNRRRTECMDSSTILPAIRASFTTSTRSARILWRG